MKRLLAVLLLALIALAQSSSKPNTYLTLDSQTRAAWFICDSVNAPAVLVVGNPDKAKVQIVRFDKKAAGQYRFQTYTLGQGDAGMGHVNYPLLLTGKEAGFIRVTNPAMLDNPQMAFTDPINSVKLNGEDLECRWVAGTRFLGINARRSVLVSQTPQGQLVYQSFDFKNPTSKPSLEIRNGKSLKSGFVFENKGYTYTLQMAWSRALLRIQQGGKPISSQTFIAFTVAKPL